MKKLHECVLEKEGPNSGQLSASRIGLLVPAIILTLMFISVGFGLWFGWTSWSVWAGYFEQSSKILYAGAGYVSKQLASGIKHITNGSQNEDRTGGPRH